MKTKTVIITSTVIIAAFFITVAFWYFSSVERSDFRYSSIETALQEGVKAELASYDLQATEGEENTDIKGHIVIETEHQGAHYYITSVFFISISGLTKDLHKHKMFLL